MKRIELKQLVQEIVYKTDYSDTSEATSSLRWERIKWPYNSDEPYASWPCWRWGKVILYPGMWPKAGWSYVAAFGPNDERSHSGFLKGFPDLTLAKKEIEKRYPNLSSIAKY
jgi:hypothetical protein